MFSRTPATAVIVATTMIGCSWTRVHLTTSFDELRTQRGGEFVRPFGTTAYNVEERLSRGYRYQGIRLSLTPSVRFDWSKLRVYLGDAEDVSTGAAGAGADTTGLRRLQVVTGFTRTALPSRQLVLAPAPTRGTPPQVGWTAFWQLSPLLSHVLATAPDADKLPVLLSSGLRLRRRSDGALVNRPVLRPTSRALFGIEEQASRGYVQLSDGDLRNLEVEVGDLWVPLADRSKWVVTNLAGWVIGTSAGEFRVTPDLTEVDAAVLDSLQHTSADSSGRGAGVPIGTPVDVYLVCRAPAGALPCMRAGSAKFLRLEAPGYRADYEFRFVSRSPLGSFVVGTGLLLGFLYYLGSG